MVNSELVEILKQGSKAWNLWREQQPDDLQPNLRYANLIGADLSGADLSDADLKRANLQSANLIEADLVRAKLSGSDLSGANLTTINLPMADLSFANLSGADLSDANLSFASLRHASLRHANLSDANLAGADLSKAIIEKTVFAHIDLREVKGLTEIRHSGPSRIELHSIQLPQDGSALHFLRGAGVPDEWIDFYRATMMQPIQYHSCFISYSSQDDALARRLHADLQDRGVRCWFAPEDMKIGDKLRVRIDEAIHLQDKLLLILSRSSVASDWVEHEVEMALAKERKEKRVVLFPVRIDDAILQQEYRGWPTLVQSERHIGDFTNWTNPQVYEQAFERLLRDLKA